MTSLTDVLARVESLRTDDHACWLWPWPGATGNGYPKVRVGGRMVYVHRLLAAERAPLEPGQVVRHSCDTPLCVNPNHVEAGTQSQNIQESYDRGRKQSTRKAVCGNGHLMDEANCYWYESPPGKRRRYCRACHAERQGRWRQSRA